MSYYVVDPDTEQEYKVSAGDMAKGIAFARAKTDHKDHLVVWEDDEKKRHPFYKYGWQEEFGIVTCFYEEIIHKQGIASSVSRKLR